MDIRPVLYMLSLLAIIFLIIFLNGISVAEGVTVGAGDFILRYVGLVSIFMSLKKYICGK